MAILTVWRRLLASVLAVVCVLVVAVVQVAAVPGRGHSVAPPSVPVGGGLTGEYFATYAGYDVFSLLDHQITRTDSTLDTSIVGIPSQVTPTDGYAMRWSGYVTPTSSGVWFFALSSSAPDGYNLSVEVNGKGVYFATRQPGLGWLTFSFAPIALTAGTSYKIVAIAEFDNAERRVVMEDGYRKLLHDSVHSCQSRRDDTDSIDRRYTWPVTGHAVVAGNFGDRRLQRVQCSGKRCGKLQHPDKRQPDYWKLAVKLHKHRFDERHDLLLHRQVPIQQSGHRRYHPKQSVQ